MATEISAESVRAVIVRVSGGSGNEEKVGGPFGLTHLLDVIAGIEATLKLSYLKDTITIHLLHIDGNWQARETQYSNQVELVH